MQNNFQEFNGAAAQPVIESFGSQMSGIQSFGVGIAANSEDIYDANRRRLAFVCGWNQIELTPLESGQASAFLPHGKLMKFVAAKISVPTYEVTDPDKPSSELKTFSAKFFLDTTIQKTGRHPHEQGTKDIDYGVRGLSMLVGLNYQERFQNERGEPCHEIFNDLADVYFDVVYPSVGARGVSFVCPEGLTDCPTCSLKWLNSQNCQNRISEAMSKGYDSLVLTQLLAALKESVTQSIRHANIMWNRITSDVNQAKQGKPGKNGLDDSDHHIRKMIHQVAPELQQTNAIIEASKQTGVAMAEATTNAMEKAFARMTGISQPQQNEELEVLKQENSEIKEQNAQILGFLKTLAPAVESIGKLGERLDAIENSLTTKDVKRGAKKSEE